MRRIGIGHGAADLRNTLLVRVVLDLGEDVLK
jgi:hypothetical protein